MTCSSCVCPPGYTGDLCGEDVDECATSPCQNGATCTNTHGGFECVCAGGFTGTNCSVDIDECEGNPCLNGGTCVDGVNGFNCSCVPNFTGLTCAGEHHAVFEGRLPAPTYHISSVNFQTLINTGSKKLTSNKKNLDVGMEKEQLGWGICITYSCIPLFTVYM